MAGEQLNDRLSVTERLSHLSGRVVMAAAIVFPGVMPESTPSADAAAVQIAEHCVPAGLDYSCPTVTQKPNDSLTWVAESSFGYLTDENIWLMIGSGGNGNYFWGLGNYQHQTSGCVLTGENVEFQNGDEVRYAPDPSKDFGAFQTEAPALDPIVSLQVNAYCPHFSPKTQKNGNWTPAEITIGKTAPLKGDFAPKTVVETYMGSCLVGIAVKGKLGTNIPGRIGYNKEVAMVSENFTRSRAGKPWIGKMTITEPKTKPESFSESPLVIRSNLNGDVAGRVAGKVLIDGKLKPETVNWSLDLLNSMDNP